jgi:hypothetical protein
MGVSAAILAVGAIGGAAASGAFNKPKTPPATIATPPPMPTPNDAAVQAAQRRSLAQQLGRRGRSSTILTGQDETLG